MGSSRAGVGATATLAGAALGADARGTPSCGALATGMTTVSSSGGVERPVTGRAVVVVAVSAGADDPRL